MKSPELTFQCTVTDTKVVNWSNLFQTSSDQYVISPCNAMHDDAHRPGNKGNNHQT